MAPPDDSSTAVDEAAVEDAVTGPVQAATAQDGLARAEIVDAPATGEATTTQPPALLQPDTAGAADHDDAAGHEELQAAVLGESSPGLGKKRQREPAAAEAELEELLFDEGVDIEPVAEPAPKTRRLGRLKKRAAGMEPMQAADSADRSQPRNGSPRDQDGEMREPDGEDMGEAGRNEGEAEVEDDGEYWDEEDELEELFEGKAEGEEEEDEIEEGDDEDMDAGDGVKPLATAEDEEDGAGGLSGNLRADTQKMLRGGQEAAMHRLSRCLHTRARKEAPWRP